jgi:hypothetical protein
MVCSELNVAQQFHSTSQLAKTFRHCHCVLYFLRCSEDTAIRRGKRRRARYVAVSECMMQVLMNTGACKKAIEHGDRGVRRWQMIEADESWARRDHQQQRWLLLAGFGHVPAGRPAFSSTDQTGRKRTITHSTAGTICHQGLRSTLKAQDDRVPMCIPSTLRPFSHTHSLT